MKKTDAEWNLEHPKSRSGLSRNPCRVENHLVSRVDEYSIVEMLMQEAVEKLDDLLINMAEQAMANTLETCDADQNRVFIKGALRNA